MMPGVLRIVQAPSNQPKRSANASNGRYVGESEGKNFLLSLMEQSERDGGSAPRSQKTSSTDRKHQSDQKADNPQESKIENVVNEMGLSYFFVLQEQEAENHLPDVTLSEAKKEVSINILDASQLLAKLGFTSDEISSLQLQAGENGRIDLETLINFLSSHIPAQDGATLKGEDLSKILAGISFNGEPLHFSLHHEKQFSLAEIRNILDRIAKLPKETNQDLTAATLQKPSEAVMTSEISSYQGTGKENQPEVYERNMQDTFAKTVIFAKESANNTENSNLNEKLTANYNPASQAQTIDSPKQPNGEILEMSKSPLATEYAEKDIPFSNLSTSGETLKLAEKLTANYNPASQAQTIDSPKQPNGEILEMSKSLLATESVVKDIPSSNFSGFGDGKFSQNFTFSHQLGEVFIQTADMNTSLPGAADSFGQVLNQVQPQTSQTTQVISQTAVAPQLASYIQQMRQEGSNQLVLQLEPKELGRIVVKLSAKDHKISTTIKTENEEVSDLLRKNSDALRQYLEEQGLSLEEFAVETENGGGSGYDRQSSYKTAFSSQDNSSTLVGNELVFQKPAPTGNVGYANGHLIYFYA